MFMVAVAHTTTSQAVPTKILTLGGEKTARCCGPKASGNNALWRLEILPAVLFTIQRCRARVTNRRATPIGFKTNWKNLALQ
jgi:hypothetical protein